MNEVETRVCRYFNTSGGCWYGDKCKFLHISDEKPRCKFFISSSGCRFGDNCHFSHDRSAENLEGCEVLGSLKEECKENLNPREFIGTNNNSMELMQANAASLSATLDPAAAEAVTNELAKANLNSGEHFTGIASNGTTVDVTGTSSTVATLPSSTSGTATGSLTPILESDYRCGSCKRPVIAQGNESYYNLLKDHYLECFMGKEGDHVKYVKFKAALEPGQMYWCKTCILVFEKPWSLFQHMGDKATGTRLQRWERKAHMDWLDTVAGLMAGHDLGLFTPAKLRADLRNLLADRRTMEEEMESAALTAAAAMMQFLEHISNPIIAQKAERYLHMGGGLNSDRRAGSAPNPFPGFIGTGFSKFTNANRFLNNLQHGGADRTYYGGRGRFQPQNALQGTPFNPAPPQRNQTTLIRNPSNKPLGSGLIPMSSDLALDNKPESGSGDMVVGASMSQSAAGGPPPDWTCGFTEEEVRELLSHGIQPWEPEAAAALSALRGELDHLLG